jgi:hypothetical protein
MSTRRQRSLRRFGRRVGRYGLNDHTGTDWRYQAIIKAARIAGPLSLLDVMEISTGIGEAEQRDQWFDGGWCNGCDEQMRKCVCGGEQEVEAAE